MIEVCDAIPGSGKSSSCINYINERPFGRFVYIAPFLDEAKRIADACPGHHFVEPIEGLPDCDYTKTGHIEKLLEGGKNVATTHQAFMFATEKLLTNAREGHYTLLIDESVSCLEELQGADGDIELLVKGGVLTFDGEKYHAVPDSYHGSALRFLLRILESRELVKLSDDKEDTHVYYWQLPATFLRSFDNVIIMTYRFEGSDMYYMLKMNGLEYKRIGIRRNGDMYHFDEHGTYMPSYVEHLSSLIHICDHKKLNRIGDPDNAFSKNWYLNNTKTLPQIKLNISNYFKHVSGSTGQKNVLWSTYADYEHDLHGKGYTKSFLACNARATNEYLDRQYLVYLVNLFLRPGQKGFFHKANLEVNQEEYALSTMIQWIWRSAIRNGREIWIYLPSSRMRRILIDWIASVERQYAEYQRSISLPSGQEGGER